MRAFDYVRPATLAEAVDVVAGREDARFLGGGTNLVDLMKLGVERPGLLADVRQLLDDRIEVRADGGVSIGAAARNSEIAAARAVRERYPAVAQALLAGASGQLRNLATAGGNLLQRTRCLYFQDVAKPCNKRAPGSGCPARAGVHRNLAVLGTSATCIATHPSDFAVALAAFDAQVRVTGVAGERTLPLTELHRLPGEEPERDTVLARGDLITRIELPPVAPGTRSRYRKVRDRASFAFALVSVAAAVLPSSGDVRIALGGVAHRPWRATRAEAALRGVRLTEERALAAMDLELETAQPLPETAFKLPLARRLVAATVLDLSA